MIPHLVPRAGALAVLFLISIHSTLMAQPSFDAQGVVYSARAGGGALAVGHSGDVFVLEAAPSPDSPSTAGVWVVRMDEDARTVLYRTFLGHGTGSGLAADALGNVYVTGTAVKGDFRETSSFTTAATSRAAFVVKLDDEGNIVYSVLVGGADATGSAIAVDASGNAYATGTTNSADFPTTTGAYDRLVNEGEYGYADTFVFKLNSTGTALVYSTYIGGTGTDESAAIAVDPAGNAYVVGSTLSGDFPTTAAAFQPKPALAPFDPWDTFVAKLNPAGTALQYSTYLGGNSIDRARGVAVNDAGEAYFAIQTYSSDLLVTPGAAQGHGGQYDGYVIRLDSAGSVPRYATYLGGTDFENLGGIALDFAGNAVVTGSTLVYSFPTTPGSVLSNRDPNGDQADVFVTKLNEVGGIVYSTLAGGYGADEFGVAVAVGENNDIYVSGGGADTAFAYTAGTVATPGTISSYPGQPPTKPFVIRLAPRVSRTRSASASSEASSVFAATAVADANFLTRWTSAAGNTQWLTVDLGGRVNIDRVVVHWAGNQFPRFYEIQVSSDLVSWQTLVSGASDGGIDDARASGLGRYVRLYCTQHNDASGYSIWEVDVYGEPAEAPNQAPTVRITSPADGWTFLGAAIVNVVAEPSDTDGTISRVDFSVDGRLVATDRVRPFVYTATFSEETRTSTIHVVAYDDRGDRSVAAPENTITIHQQGLPDSWSASDVGEAGRAGQASVAGDSFVLDAGGTDLWGTADAFYFMRRSITGDADVITRVDALARPADAVFALAGVMFRESLAPGSRHAAVVITTQGKAKFRRRITTGGPTLSDGPGMGSMFAPAWVKLSRRGNVFSAYLSTNGTTWIRVHTSQTVALPATVDVGIMALRSGGTGLARAAFSNVSVTTPLPAGWTSADIGAVGVAGSAVESAGTFTLRGAGADVWGTADAFHYVYRPLAGNGTIVARVAAITGPEAWTKAGVMIRASTAPSSAQAFMLVSVRNGVAFQQRTTNAGISTHTYGGSGTAPRWVRLQRTGSTIAGSVSTDGIVWNEVGRATFTMPSAVLIGLATTSHTVAALATAGFDQVAITTTLPTNWESRDIGAVGLAGSAVASNGTFTLKGAGADVWGTADAFHYAYQQLAGDGTMVARVATIAGTQAWTKMGVMIRDTIDPGAAYAFMLVSLGKGVAFQRRTAAGAAATNTSGGPGTAPRWVKLRRSGNSITAAVSMDGATWTDVGRDTFTMASTVLIGLAAHGHATTALATGTFDHVTLTNGTISDIVVTAPAPGTTLRQSSATFRWTGTGDEFWLNIGSTPGGSDMWASGSLGAATEHTVSRLPLNGKTMYVQVRRRIGTAIDTVNVQYTAPIRKALAVITDFADRKLEDFTGAGMNNLDDVGAQLREMEAHWGWLSRGLERVRWDIIRVTLPQSCVAGAFPDWTQFRASVAGLVRQQIAVADYDLQGDGAVDAAWFVVSSGGNTAETGCAQQIENFALGGASANGGVSMFVDGQASGSVTAGATGNFNHEFGHLLGLRDMYGPYDTVHGLTVMSYSWPVPPHDFTAYERVKLGWLEPRLLTQTTSDVWLPSAHETLAAVKIPTSRDDEYFLIEYRRQPDTGYGSEACQRGEPCFLTGLNGLAVYHVLEGSSMWQDPPIVKLEPADGSVIPEDGLDQADFVYPENPVLLRPLVVRSYFGGGAEVFRIENVRWQAGGLAFDVMMAPALPR